MSAAAPLNSDPVLAVAVRAAHRAASIVVDAARDLKRLPSSSKEHAGIVSAADGDAEDAIVATLRAAFPEHAILGAQARLIPGARERPGFKWLVDPLDDAANFAHGYPHYAVSIALARGSELTHAVVLDPVHDELFSAALGKGAQLNGTTLRASACTQLADALVGSAAAQQPSAAMRADYEQLFNALAPQCAGIRRSGSCALDLCYVASGRLDGLFVTGLAGWDIAAGALIVKEAGGRVGDFAGGSDFLPAEHIIAAASGVFGPLRNAIAAAIRP